MSYQQNYSATVPFSGSQHVSYPASEKGGSMTVRYSGQIPINVGIRVNTEPFDSSVSRCNGSIDLLSSSVVAMNAAQCAAIKETGRAVSQAIINGFYGAINTELSQQIQALDSAVKANFGLIEQQAKAVSAQKVVMETDYNRISSRYTTLFADLDSECHKRIYALDKKSFLLSQKIQEELLSEKNRNNAAFNLLESIEESSSKLLLAISRINRTAREVLYALREYISQETKIERLIGSFIMQETADEPAAVYNPALVAETIQPESAASVYNAYIPEYMTEDQKTEIARRVIAECSTLQNDAWADISVDEREILNREFTAAAENHFEGKDGVFEKRMYAVLLSLWQNAGI
ncbi:MAG: hypothetical protein LBC77_01475 [Spirochaetaceae bacterium]|nr:hypothetical protein [Spirochaetaceae bacterium]